MIVVDTSVILAAFDASDALHARARAFFTQAAGPFVVSPFVLAEVDYLVMSRRGTAAEIAVLRALSANPFAMVAAEQELVADCLAVLDRPRHAGLGLADASLVALSESLGVPIATFDRRHFPQTQLPS